MSNTDVKPPKEATLVRLTPEVYLSLESKFRAFKPNEQSNQLQAGYELGVQAVLRELRAGYVVVA